MFWKEGVNGLGVLGFHLLPCRRLFDDAARRHDAEYDEKGTWRDRRDWDIFFFEGMLYVCRTDAHVACAVVYYVCVRLLGWLFYRYNKS